MQAETLIPKLFKTEYRKIVSVLCKSFGMSRIEIAEDITNDTFLQASETWGLKGIPENPSAWLYTVAKNKCKDYFKREKVFTEKIAPEIKDNTPLYDSSNIDLSDKNIEDSQLQMLFVICDTSIPTEAQIGLSLRILCGFGIDEIAEAFLSNKETINKRLFRAKEKLRELNLKIELPNEVEIDKRLETVLSTIYLLFNEGYHSSTQNISLRKDLCLEAMRLNHLLLENARTNKPIVNALMSLMCFHASRFEARLNTSGETILYDAQDKDLWDQELINKGNHFLIESARGTEVSKYHLEASIAYWHSSKTELPNKWENILQLYNQLLQIDYSPVAALNRTYALFKTNGAALAIVEAKKLDLEQYPYYHALLGKLHADLDKNIAEDYFKKALSLTKSAADKTIIQKYIEAL
jgi:RNA polymerase sigma factor (sigma-70 family)